MSIHLLPGHPITPTLNTSGLHFRTRRKHRRLTQAMSIGLMLLMALPFPTHIGLAAPPTAPTASPAIDAGNPATPGSGGGACQATDQRGTSRPRDGDGNGSSICDIGAYEK